MLCIVSVYRPDLLREVAHMIGTAGVPMAVVLDRRHGERRSPERVDRLGPAARGRRRLDIDGELQREGFAIIH
jgi:hypothetical protein